MHPVELTLHQKLMRLNPFGSDTKLWLVSTFWGVALALLVSGYYAMVRHSFSVETMNVVLADVALLLIGCSFLLSSLCYFWNFADKYIIYRKHFGLVGFLLGLTHIIMSLIIFPEYVNLTTFDVAPDFLAQFIYGLIAFAIYAMMAVISNRFAVHELGGMLWRRLLRVGYIAYVATLLHFAVSLYPLWLRWAQLVFTSPRLPAFHLIEFVFGCVVVGMRIALWIHLLISSRIKARSLAQTFPTPAPLPQPLQTSTPQQTFVTTNQQFRP